jgi:hypothetical protein
MEDSLVAADTKYVRNFGRETSCKRSSLEAEKDV